MNNYKEEIEKLQEQLNILKSKIDKHEFVVGMWYKTNYKDGDNLLGCFVKLDYYGNYGFTINGKWTNSLSMTSAKGWTLATHEEIKEALKKEAVKRGFKDRIKLISTDGTTSKKTLMFNDLEFDVKENWLCDGWGNIVFQNGKWAEPVNIMTLDELINSASYLNMSNLRKYVTENKTKIIETLNNL